MVTANVSSNGVNKRRRSEDFIDIYFCIVSSAGNLLFAAPRIRCFLPFSLLRHEVGGSGSISFTAHWLPATDRIWELSTRDTAAQSFSVKRLIALHPST